MLTVLLLLSVFRYYGIKAAPVAPPDPFSNDLAVFARADSSSADSGRTLWDILWSCLATTFAVTWVSVHPNVPWLGENHWSILKRRIFLMVLAFLAPEVMIMWTFKQRRGAVMIKELVNKAKPEYLSSEWTREHGYFLQMGGFKIVCTEEEKAEMDECNELLEWSIVTDLYWYHSDLGNDMWEGVLRFWAFCYLLKKHKIDFPKTTVEEINDRSKGDGALSKGFALLQITWFILQLIARHAQGLAVTELELTTAALAGINSVMYLFWWSKPLDVRCPIVLHTKGVRKILADTLNDHELMERQLAMDKLTDERILRNESQAFWWPEGLLYEKESLEDELKGEVEDALGDFRKAGDHSWLFEDPDEFQLRDHLWISPLFRSRSEPSDDTTLDTESERPEGSEKPPSNSIAGGSSAGEQEGRDTVPEANPSPPSGDDHTVFALPCIRAGFHLIKRYFRGVIGAMKSVIKKLILLQRIFMFMPMDLILQPNHSYLDLRLRESCSDAREKIHDKSNLKLLFDENDMDWIMSMIFYSEEADSEPLLYFSAIIGIAFGSIHCAAWNFTFPSPVEKSMWRTASLVLVGVCFSIFCGKPAEMLIKPVMARKVERYSNEYKFASYYFFKDISFIPTIIYPIARLTLLILAILSLRSLHEMDTALQPSHLIRSCFRHCHAPTLSIRFTMIFPLRCLSSYALLYANNVGSYHYVSHLVVTPFVPAGLRFF